MNKARVETLSDGVFAIAMTLLILDVRLPHVDGALTDAELWTMLAALWPIVVSYVFSFLILAVAWLNHHFLFHAFAKEVNRQLNLLNLLYLMMIVFVPFSAHLLGSYITNQPAVIIYGLNILAVVGLSYSMLHYITRHHTLFNEHTSQRMVKQGKIRSTLSIISYVIGVGVSFIYPPLSVVFYVFPLVFNIIPGTLDFSEWLLGLDLK